jgi:hypothetical protein
MDIFCESMPLGRSLMNDEAIVFTRQCLPDLEVKLPKELLVRCNYQHAAIILLHACRASSVSQIQY